MALRALEAEHAFGRKRVFFHRIHVKTIPVADVSIALDDWDHLNTITCCGIHGIGPLGNVK